MIKKLRENAGFSYVWGAVVVMVAVALFSIIAQAMRCTAVINRVDNSLQICTNRVGTENIHNTSKGIREGNSAAYVYNPYGDNWNESVMDDQLIQLMKSELGLTAEGGKLVRKVDGSVQYSLSNISINSANATLAGNNGRTLTFTAEATVSVPFFALGDISAPVTLDRTAKATFTNKF